jgi:hypothetical protein
MAATAGASGFAVTAWLAAAARSFPSTFSRAFALLRLVTGRVCRPLGRQIFGSAIRMRNALPDQFLDR